MWNILILKINKKKTANALKKKKIEDLIGTSQKTTAKWPRNV